MGWFFKIVGFWCVVLVFVGLLSVLLVLVGDGVF